MTNRIPWCHRSALTAQASHGRPAPAGGLHAPQRQLHHRLGVERAALIRDLYPHGPSTERQLSAQKKTHNREAALPPPEFGVNRRSFRPCRVPVSLRHGPLLPPCPNIDLSLHLRAYNRSSSLHGTDFIFQATASSTKLDDPRRIVSRNHADVNGPPECSHLVPL